MNDMTCTSANGNVFWAREYRKKRSGECRSRPSWPAPYAVLFHPFRLVSLPPQHSRSLSEQACSQACALCAAPRASLFRITRVQRCRALTDLVIVRLRGHFSQRKACRADPLHAVSVGSESSLRAGPPCLASAGRARRGQWGCGARGGRIVGR